MHKQVMSVCRYLPLSIRRLLEKIAQNNCFSIQEIRLRTNKPLSLTIGGQNLFVTHKGELTALPSVGYCVTAEDIHSVFMCACQNSVYAYSRELQNGFITLSGGHRMGLCGRIVYENHAIKTICDISSLSIRIADEKKGCSREILPYLIRNEHVCSCAIISPPGGGKTTVLRDIARSLSLRGYRVCVIDERGELAGCDHGISRYDLGPSCDVLDGCDKIDGLEWGLRCLSPSVMIVDELGSDAEAHAVLQGISGGVSTVFTLHAATMQQAMLRSPMQLLTNQKVLDLCVLLGSAREPGKIVGIYDISCKEEDRVVQSLWDSSS